MSSKTLLYGHNVRTVPNIQALRDESVKGLERGAQIGVGGTDQIGDFGGGVYQWVPTSVLPDDGINVILPTSNPRGRWHRIGVSAAGVVDSIGDSTLVAPSQAAVNRLVNGTYLYAGNFGVKGDADVVNGQVTGTDDTQAIQSFLNLCQTKRRIAYFGGLRCKVSGPLTLVSTGMIFDGQGYATADPGLYPVGSGYTVLKAQGIIPDMRVGVYGTGNVVLDNNNNITSDTRPNVTGVQLSGSQGDNAVMALSKVSYIRVWNLPRGILLKGIWDCNLDKLSVEFCGGAGSDDYGIDIQDGGFVGQTSNECVVAYIQSEHAYNRAIRISPNLLSTGFSKIHSERAFAKAGVNTWELGGGSCTYANVRLDGQNPNNINGVCSISGASTTYNTVRGENMSFQYSAYQGATVTFNECSGLFRPFANQNGKVNFVGGNITFNDVDGYTTIYSCTIPTMTCGFMPAGKRAKIVDCTIGSLSATSTTAVIDIIASMVQITPSNSFGGIRLFNGSELSPTTGTSITFGYQYVFIDEGSVIKANVTADFAGIELNGTIQGNLSLITQPRSVAGSNAKVTGSVNGWTAPGGSEYIGQSYNGRYTKNLAVVTGQPTGWIYSGGSWKPLANL